MKFPISPSGCAGSETIVRNLVLLGGIPHVPHGDVAVAHAHRLADALTTGIIAVRDGHTVTLLDLSNLAIHRPLNAGQAFLVVFYKVANGVIAVVARLLMIQVLLVGRTAHLIRYVIELVGPGLVVVRKVVHRQALPVLRGAVP